MPEHPSLAGLTGIDRLRAVEKLWIAEHGDRPTAKPVQQPAGEHPALVGLTGLPRLRMVQKLMAEWNAEQQKNQQRDGALASRKE
jgi:hypothetical protein